MLYEMARRYDEWAGEKYSGSSARGAVKGWHKHGVCSESHWPYKAGDFLNRYVIAPRVAPVWATAVVLLFLSVFVARNYWQVQETERLLTSLPIEEVELIDNIELAENIFKTAKLKYEQGVGSNLEVLNAETSLKEAQANYFNALYEALVSKVDYDKANVNVK